jgi:hypothetical protein
MFPVFILSLLLATISFIMSDRPSFLPSACNNSGPTVPIRILIFECFFIDKIVENVQVSLKYDKNNDYVT